MLQVSLAEDRPDVASRQDGGVESAPELVVRRETMEEEAAIEIGLLHPPQDVLDREEVLPRVGELEGLEEAVLELRPRLPGGMTGFRPLLSDSTGDGQEDRLDARGRVALHDREALGEGQALLLGVHVVDDLDDLAPARPEPGGAEEAPFGAMGQLDAFLTLEPGCGDDERPGLTGTIEYAPEELFGATEVILEAVPVAVDGNRVALTAEVDAHYLRLYAHDELLQFLSRDRTQDCARMSTQELNQTEILMY